MEREILLEAKHIFKTFGPTKALADVSIKLEAGQIHGLMGENGSGKSTLSSIIAAIQPADEGEMTLFGQPYRPKTMLEALDKGVCMIMQEQGTFTDATVAQNIFIGKENKFTKNRVLSVKAMNKEAKAHLETYQMGHLDPAESCARLSFEDCKLIEVARAMYYDPAVLIIDETTSALSKMGRDILYSIMRRMKEAGKCVVFISHDIDELLEYCDVLTILRDGKMIETLEKERFDTELVKQLMVGREMVGAYYRTDFGAPVSEEAALTAQGLCSGIVRDVSFTAHKGEILGIGGLNDCGMHELGKMLFGLTKLSAGKMCYQGDKEYRDPTRAMDYGIGYISKNRDKEAMMTASSIRDNICLPSLKKLARGGLISNRREKDFVEEYAKVLSIKMDNINQLCMHLSGGNKQKVVIAKWIGFGAEILIMDCPTRGIDIGVKAEIYRLMEKIKSEGKTIILISEELSELIGMSDRILLMKQGKISAEFSRSEDLTDQQLIHYMI